MSIQEFTPVRGFDRLRDQNTAGERQGEIRPQNSTNNHHNKPYAPNICIQKYGTWVWEPLRLLSAAKWTQLRSKISSDMSNIFKQMSSEKLTNLKKDQKIKNEAMILLHDLYGRLDREEKKAFLNRHKKSFMAEFTCRACLEYCADLKFCIHINCTGICDSCLSKNKDECLACGQKQEKQCPICQDSKKADELMASNSCRHDVCYKCYAMAFKSGRPIWDCPLCRQEFTHVTDAHKSSRQLQFDSDDEFSDDGIDVAPEEEIWEDPADFDILQQAEESPAETQHRELFEAVVGAAATVGMNVRELDDGRYELYDPATVAAARRAALSPATAITPPASPPPPPLPPLSPSTAITPPLPAPTDIALARLIVQ